VTLVPWSEKPVAGELKKQVPSLSLMSIESEFMKEIDFDDVINDLILAKRRKINF